MNRPLLSPFRALPNQRIIFKIKSFKREETFSENFLEIIDHERGGKPEERKIEGLGMTIQECLEIAHDRRKENLEIHITEILPCCQNCHYHKRTFWGECTCSFWPNNLSECHSFMCENYLREEDEILGGRKL